MGHIRLGTLPRTHRWIQVLDLVGGGVGTPDVAAATMDASQGGLIRAAKDPGLVYTVWLLTQVPLAARSDDFAARLRKIGLTVRVDREGAGRPCGGPLQRLPEMVQGTMCARPGE